MTLEQLNEMTCFDGIRNTQVWQLLERVLSTMTEEGIEPLFINGAGMAAQTEKLKNNPGVRYVAVGITHRHNGTAENTTCKIRVEETCGFHGLYRKVICKVKVPKNASEKVIRNRIEKIKEFLNA